MAEHGSSGSTSQDFDAHQATYNGFIKGSVALTLLCIYTLIALVVFRFVNNFNLLLGFGGLVIGIVAVLIDLKASGKWFLSGAWAVIFGLVTAVAIS
ncbi:MAG: aa3-type cytochrome c oxidase subunit IV [Alphaproteobacteria bacterium]|nr:aa3-type cytochrome c oxidase subunit IV [Alphaproteobacteria bacterium]